MAEQEGFEHIRLKVPQEDKVIQAGIVETDDAEELGEFEEPIASEAPSTSDASRVQDPSLPPREPEATPASPVEAERQSIHDDQDGLERIPMSAMQKAVIIACAALIIVALIYYFFFMG